MRRAGRIGAVTLARWGDRRDERGPRMALRVMSYNILLGGQDRLAGIARTIRGVVNAQSG